MRRRSDTNQTPSPAILALDPSLTAFGWCVVQNNTVVDSGCIKTTPEAKKRRIREGDDRVRRTSELIEILLNVIRKYDISFIVCELPHGSQNSRAAVMIGIVVGMVQAISICEDIPVEWFSEADAKKALLGRISASKAEVIQTIEEKLDVKIKGPKYVREAIADALAIYYVATIQSPTLKILMR